MENPSSEPFDPMAIDRQLICEGWGEHLTLASTKKRDVKRLYRRTLYEKSLIDFGKSAWPIIEPGREFIPNPHIDAICEHLQAVTRGDIKRLVINVSPGAGKSIWISALWPCWAWTNDPFSRWLFASYSSNNTIRDSRKRRELIKSSWFRNYWWGWRLKDDQDTAHRFENSRQGFMLATSIGSGSTGEHANVLVCLPGWARITTSLGQIPIEDIVKRKRSVRVLGYDHGTQTTKWCDIEAYESTVGRNLVRLTVSDGRRVECTEDHPVYVEGRGYIQANAVRVGDEVLIRENVPLPKMRNRIPSQAMRTQGILLPQVLGAMASRAKHAYVPAMWEGVLQVPRPFRKVRECARSVLQQDLFRTVAVRKQSSSLQERLYALRSMRGRATAAHTKTQNQVLFPRVQEGGKSHLEACKPSRVCVQALRKSNPTLSIPSGTVAVLFPPMFVLRAQKSHSRGEQRAIRSRSLLGAVSSRVQTSKQRREGAGRQMLAMQYGSRAVRQTEDGCTSHRLRQAQQQSRQSCDSMPMVSRSDARRKTGSGVLDKAIVVAVEKVATVPEKVFNLKVKGCHNYFANDILVHNCDDPHDRMDRYSKVKRDEAINWYKTVFTSLNLGPDTRYVIVAQRITEDDMTGYVLANELGYEHLCIPLTYDSQHPHANKTTCLGWRDWRTKDGEVMWPEMFPPATLENLKKEKSSYDLAAQYQQNPTRDEGAMFPRSNFLYFKSEGYGDDEVLTLYQRDGSERHVMAAQCQWFQCADTALETTDSSAWTVVGTFLITPQPAAMLVYDIARERLSVPKQYGFLVTQRARFPRVTAQYVEKKASGHGLIQEGAMRGNAFGALKAQGSKDMRLVPASIQYENGVVYHRMASQASWLAVFENEMAGVPDTEYRDQSDTVAYAGMMFQRYWISEAYSNQSLAYVPGKGESRDGPEAPALPQQTRRLSLAEQLTGRRAGGNE